MAIIASLPNPNLFSSLPSIPPPNDPTSSSSTSPLSPPIPIPKYLPPKSNQNPQKKLSHSSKSPPNPALKASHSRTKYYKPVRDGVISSDGDRSVVIGETGVSYLLPGAPFEFQYSYSETPKVKPIAIREPAFLPFAPPSMPRPWTGKAPLKTAREKKMKRKIPLFDTSIPPQPGNNGLKQLEMPGSFPFGKYPQERKTREEILGEPLKKWEIRMLLKPLVSDNRQVNLGRDGLTHNMLELIHSHWRRQQVCKVRCKGVPTVDMNNVCRHLEEKTGGKIIHRVGGVVYLFRGRNYKYHSRPQYPVMLWKPAAPVYPKLIQEAPEGLTKSEADDLRLKGKKLLPICKLAKNGVYTNLLRDVRHAFEGSPLVKIDCKGMHASDYKKLGAKLKELVPCVLLSFDDEQILMWRGSNRKSMYLGAALASNYYTDNIVDGLDCSADADDNSSKSGTIIARMSPKMMSLWKNAIETNKALLLDEIPHGPEALLLKVEEFENISQATEHSYPARILSNAEGMSSLADYEDVTEIESDGSYDEFDRDEDGYGDDYDDDVLNYESDSQVPIGSLAIDQIANRLKQE